MPVFRSFIVFYLSFFEIVLKKFKMIYIFHFLTAERKTSLGKDWHGPCLKCERCKKTLNPGGHSEHDGKPYCTNPCYGALFGPGGRAKPSMVFLKLE